MSEEVAAFIRKELGMSAALSVILLIIVWVFNRLFTRFFREKERRKKWWEEYVKNVGTKFNPKRFTRDQIKFYIIIVPIAFFMALPIVYLFVSAFKPLDELLEFPPKFFVRNPVKTIEISYYIWQEENTLYIIFFFN